MRSKLDFYAFWNLGRLTGCNSRKVMQSGAITLSAVLCLLASGCMGSLQKHTTALSTATAPVVDGAAAAYQAANTIHEKRTDYDAIAEFDQTAPVYNPRILHPLLSEQSVDIRLAVLKAFQCYVETLVEITSGTESPELDEASKSVGKSLAALGNTLVPASSTASTTSAEPAVTISPATQNALSAGANALGQFLVYRAIKKDLPQKVKDMDPHVQALCKLMADEVDVLLDAETKDFDSLINRETLFLRDPAGKLSTQERREAIMQLPKLGREQHLADLQLTQLKAAIVNLALTHHALAADAQGNNPESLTGKLGELEAAGKKLNKFYSSLSSD
jgi:hypothetical protein